MTHLTESQLNQYLDNELDLKIRDEVETHLSFCSHCQSQLQELACLFSILERLPDLPIQKDLTADVLSHLPVREQPPVIWFRPLFIIQSLLAVFLIVSSIPLLQKPWGFLTAWMNKLLTELQFPIPNSIIAHLPSYYLWDPGFAFRIPEISINVPKTHALLSNLDVNLLLIFVIASGTLWFVGNFTLLRERKEARG